MINSIFASGRYTVVTGGTSFSYYPPPQPQPQSITGQLRLNGSTLEVFDGNGWISASNFTSIGLTTEAEELLDWVRKKRDEERNLETLSKTNPAIADLMHQVKEKLEQIEVVKILSETNNGTI